MSETISSLQTSYLLEQEKARLDREENGDFTKVGLRHLISAAKIQLRLASLTEGEAADQHQAMGYKIIQETHAHMKRLGLIVPEVRTPQAAFQDSPHSKHNNQDSIGDVSSIDQDEDPFEQLNSLIGLKNAKETINGILNQLKVNDLRKQSKLPLLDVPLHMVFVGHAGTGKTTVARIVAKILKKMGLLSKGHLIEVKSSDLIEGYVGQTGKKTKEIIDSAKGGVLFIDEAYALGENKFGIEEAIPTLLISMENYRDDLAVIVAGYTENMRNFIKSNEGLSSRFTHMVHFDDYSAGEMMDIFKSMCSQKEQTLSKEAEELLYKVFEQKSHDPEFGNARGVRNLFNQANISQASRIVNPLSTVSSIQGSMLTTFEKVDIEEAAAHAENHRL